MMLPRGAAWARARLVRRAGPARGPARAARRHARCPIPRRWRACDMPALMPLHDLMTHRFVHDRSLPLHGPVPAPAPPPRSPDRRPVPAGAARSPDPAACSSRSFGVRSQFSTRTSASSACVRCLASQFPARLRRGSRNAVGTPCTCANASRGLASTNAACSALAPCSRSITPLTSWRRQRLTPRQRQHRFLVARGQPRQLPRQRRTHQTQTQILFHRHAQLLQQRQPPAHPTLVLAQQMRRFHLRHAVVTHQRLHDPRFLQFPRRPLVRGSAPGSPPWPSRSSTSSTRTLRVVKPRNLPRRRPTLEAVEQFQLLFAHAGHHRRQAAPSAAAIRPSLPPLPDRPGDNADNAGPDHPAPPAVTLPSFPVHARTLHAPTLSKKGNGGRKIAFTPARSLLRLGSGNFTLSATMKRICKDMRHDVSGGRDPPGHALDNACADAAPDSALPDPARDVKPAARHAAKTLASNVHAASVKSS